MTGPRPAVGRVDTIAGRAVRGSHRAMAALDRSRASELASGELTGCGPVAG
jgi:hypothetical protein